MRRDKSVLAHIVVAMTKKKPQRGHTQHEWQQAAEQVRCCLRLQSKTDQGKKTALMQKPESGAFFIPRACGCACFAAAQYSSRLAVVQLKSGQSSRGSYGFSKWCQEVVRACSYLKLLQPPQQRCIGL
jgi:hypothetical protein